MDFQGDGVTPGVTSRYAQRNTTTMLYLLTLDFCVILSILFYSRIRCDDKTLLKIFDSSSFLVKFSTQIMARRTQRTNPPEDVTDHRFLQFPQTLNDATRERYVTNLSLLLTKEIDIAPSFDWELATRTGLYTHSDASGVDLFVCRGWARLFRIQEPVYREFLLEFYATVSYDPRKAPDDRTTFAFRLGGVSRECSVIELATRVGIYTADETRSVHFPAFIADCLTKRPDDYNENTFWAEITRGVYTPSTARGRMIRSTTYRMLHRLISMSLTHHKNSNNSGMAMR
ncbi:unnamed protein product [Lactuca saligna]|uniref:Uncharacterized protein n=1 Tax=Lactuca saligna TaxID=75948 RepID=A0AA35VHN6_LACSI|nr:unnamed protein product [Lactuca saligna]